MSWLKSNPSDAYDIVAVRMYPSGWCCEVEPRCPVCGLEDTDQPELEGLIKTERKRNDTR
jgi:hypothetical protein